MILPKLGELPALETLIVEAAFDGFELLFTSNIDVRQVGQERLELG